MSNKEIVAFNSTYFNVWEKVKESDPILYKTEIDNIERDLFIKKMTYFSNKDQGVYIFTDNKGYFTLIKKNSHLNHKSEKIFHDIIFFTRTFSGFENINIIKQQIYLTLYTQRNKIGFLRAFDGQLGNSDWFLNTTDIIDIGFDHKRPGVFYVLSSDGEISIIKAQTKNKNQVFCEEEGRIIDNSEETTDILVLEKTLITYSNNTESLQIFNITQENEKSLQYHKILGVSLKTNFHNFGRIKVSFNNVSII